MTNALLGLGTTAPLLTNFTSILTSLTAIEYLRNLMKQVCKRKSSVILANQNIEDFLMDGVKELTKPLFSIPTHQFLFHAGLTDTKAYISTMQMEEDKNQLP